MHAVRVEVLQAQAEALGLPLWRCRFRRRARTRSTSSAMAEAVQRAVAEGFTHVAFGDLFLEDIRRIARSGSPAPG